MKISRIEIKDVNQFKNLDIDLTYPKGHAKEGLPLEKVCIIGQSGTGKTTLLKFIYGLSYNSKIVEDEYGFEKLKDKVFITTWMNEISLRSFLSIINNWDKHYNLMKVKFPKLQLKNNQTSKIKSTDAHNYLKSLNDKIKTQLIYFPAEMKYGNPTTENLPETNPKIYDFSEDNINKVWKIILEDIQKLQEKDIILTQKISKIAIEENGDTNKLQSAIDELKELRTSNLNPLIQLANDCLNPILKNFNVKVKTEMSFKTKDDIGFIKIMDSTGNEIPDGLLSTGTKQIILSALPLYILKPNQTIILYDEPERSLYPDMQKLVVDYYTSFTTDSQFFFATHSPIIASCFEPWEIVELKFNEEGYVVQEKYYPPDEERHVNNYTINPQYLTYDLMLKKVFDIQPDNEKRTEKLTEFLTLKKRLEFLKGKNEIHTEEYKANFDKYIKAGKDLLWEINPAKVA